VEAVKRAAKDAGVLLVFVVLTIAMTWPWAAHIRDTSFDNGDSYLNAWTLAWDFHQTFHDPLHLFDSNNFFPYRYTLAFSEHEWGIALLFFPAYAAGLAPLTVHGLTWRRVFHEWRLVPSLVPPRLGPHGRHGGDPLLQG
jgi:hypothetical protein